MAQSLSRNSLYPAATWSDAAGGYISPYDQKPLNYPRDSSGNAIPGLIWDPSVGDYRLPDNSTLDAPRVASSSIGYNGIGSYTGGSGGAFGGVPGSTPATTATSNGNAGPNPFFTISNQKSAPINATNNKLLTDLNSVIDTGVKDYTDYATQQFPGLEKNTNQEVGALDYLYNGGQQAKTEAELANLRGATTALQKLNQDRALSYAKGTDAAGGGANPRPFSASSTQREFLRASNEANIPLELQFANTERAWNQMDQSQKLAELGQRNAQLTALAKQKLAPVQAQQQNLQTNSGILAPISATDLAQNFYGLGGNENAIGGGQFYIPNYATPGISGAGYPQIGAPQNYYRAPVSAPTVNRSTSYSPAYSASNQNPNIIWNPNYTGGMIDFTGGSGNPVNFGNATPYSPGYYYNPMIYPNSSPLATAPGPDAPGYLNYDPNLDY